MYSLNEQQLLWGHLPLVFFSALFFFLVLLLAGRFSRDASGKPFLFLAILSGILLSLGFPPSPFTPFLFVAFVPLLWIENYFSQQGKGSTRKLFKYTYVSFVLWNILTTFWVANTAFSAAFLAIGLNAFFMCIPFLLFHKTRKIFDKVKGGDNKLSWLGFMAYWISFEYIHLRWEISWTWLTLGNGFAEYPSWVQWYEYTGVFGGTLWILLANILAFKIVNIGINKVGSQEETLSKNSFTTNFREILKQRKQIVIFSSFILLPILISMGIYFTYEEQGIEKEVVVIQPNYEPHYQKFNVPRLTQQRRFLQLSKSALSPKTDYLVFPETSFGRIKTKELGKKGVTKDLKNLVDEYPNLKLVTGIGAQKIYEKGAAHNRATRTHVRRGDTIYWESYNAAIQLESNIDDVPLYLKSKLVPGAEFLPYRELFFFLKPLVDKLGGSMSGLGMQERREAFKAQDGSTVAPVICYESVYGEYCTGYIKDGAQALFIVTNDGWWDNTAGHKQHLKFASLRAIETRRSIARSANTGISCFLNQRGDILQPTKYEVDAAIKGNIKFNSNITFYTKWGDLIGRLAGFAAIILVLNAFVQKRIHKTAS